MNNINNTWEQPNDLVTNSADTNAIRVSAEKKTPGTLIKDENNNFYVRPKRLKVLKYINFKFSHTFYRGIDHCLKYRKKSLKKKLA